MNRKKHYIFTIIFCISTTIQAKSLEIISLWSNDNPPESPKHQLNKNIKTVVTPFMAVYSPAQSNHTAILVMSGGGYAHEVLNKEGTPTSLWLQQHGFTVFELVYRLPMPEQANTRDLPFADAQRALRLIKATGHFQHIGVMGFSAGGHVAGMLATQWTKTFYKPLDATDTFSARPDFAVLLYPVVSMQPPLNQTHAYKVLFDANSNDALLRQYSINQNITHNTPPMFIAHAIDDNISPVANSQLLHQALQQQQISNEFILFDHGGHGWGLGNNPQTKQWPNLFLHWQQQQFQD